MSRLCLAVCVALLFPITSEAALVHNGFEVPDLGTKSTYKIMNHDLVPGWSSSTGVIEVWANRFNGVEAYQGKQFVELNAHAPGTLYQEVTGLSAGLPVGWQFAHRGRAGIDTMRLDIVDLGTNGAVGGGDDTTLFSQQFSAGKAAWVFNKGTTPLVTLGNTLRISFVAISTANGNKSVGNFLDVPDFGTEIAPVLPGLELAPVPLPAGAVLLVGGVAALGALRRRRTRTGA